MTMNVLAAGMEIPAVQLEQLRPQCVQHVKRTGGRISLQDAVDYQNGVE